MKNKLKENKILMLMWKMTDLPKFILILSILWIPLIKTLKKNKILNFYKSNRKKEDSKKNSTRMILIMKINRKKLPRKLKFYD